MSVGVFTSPLSFGNITQSNYNGFGVVRGPDPDGGIPGSGRRPLVNKNCTDVHKRLIPHGLQFVPGPDQCTLCACDDGQPIWCKAVLCSPPPDCKSFRVGNSCCDFTCLDDSLNGGPNTGGPYLSRPVEIANFVPKVVIAAVTAMLSLSLLFFLIHRLRQRHNQGRLNSARARRSTQMCDECDDTRSLDFSNDFFEHRMNSPHLYPPQYLAWWKPPSSYFPPRGEAPPPYEEAVLTTTSIRGNLNTGDVLTTTIITAPSNDILHNNNNQRNRQSGGGHIFNDIPIIVPPPILPPALFHGAAEATRTSPAAIQRLASAIASTTRLGGITTHANPARSSTTPPSPSSCSVSHTSKENGQGDSTRSEGKCSALRSGKSKGKSKSSKTKERAGSAGEEPRPGPSRTDCEPANTNGESNQYSGRSFRGNAVQHGPPPPTYEDAIYSLHTSHPREPYYHSHHRHSLTLPSRRFMHNASEIEESSSHLYPHVLVHGSSAEGTVGGARGAGPLTCYTEEEILRRALHNQNQRYSLQFNVGDGGTGHDRDDWSSSSSTLSLSTTPNSPVGGRAPSLSSSSESSVSETSPPPPAPSSSASRT